MLNPCCCISPRIGCFVFGIIDLLVSISTLSYVLSQGPWTAEKWLAVAIWIIMLLLAVCLIYGAVKNSIEKLQLWLISWIILIVLLVVAQILNLISDRDVSQRYQAYGGFVSICIFIYELLVVYAFIYELRSGGLTYCPAQLV